jgi:hypothetical protein
MYWIIVERLCWFGSLRKFLPYEGVRPAVIISIFWSKRGVAIVVAGVILAIIFAMIVVEITDSKMSE